MAARFHWEMYPHNREVPEDLVQELLGILIHAGVGTLEPESNVVLLMRSRLYDFSKLDRGIFRRRTE